MDNIFETSVESIARHREAVVGLTHDIDGVEAAVAKAVADFWPEAPEGTVEGLVREIKMEGTVGAQIRDIRQGYTETVDWKAAGAPIVRREVDGETAWQGLLAMVYGVTEAAVLRLRGDERSGIDTETGLPNAMLKRMKERRKAREGSY